MGEPIIKMLKAYKWVCEKVVFIEKWIFKNIIDTKGGYLITGVVIGGTLVFCYITIETTGIFNYKDEVVLNISRAVVNSSNEAMADAPQKKVDELGDTKIIVSPTIEKIKMAFPKEANLAIAIAKCESQLDHTRIGDTHMKKYSYGLFQINRTWHNYTPEELLNEDFNIEIAQKIRKEGGWERWSCYTNKQYLKYYEK